nr:MAG TPA: hypothetical protein [Caudoviricetes sp.]
MIFLLLSCKIITAPFFCYVVVIIDRFLRTAPTVRFFICSLILFSLSILYNGTCMLSIVFSIFFMFFFVFLFHSKHVFVLCFFKKLLDTLR